MKYDEQACAATVRSALAGKGEVREVRMFGGLGFMLNGNLAVTVSRRGMLGARRRRGRGRSPAPDRRAAHGHARAHHDRLRLRRSAGLDSKSIGKWVERALKHVLTLAVGTSKRKQR
jgi:hypothetical protein